MQDPVCGMVVEPHQAAGTEVYKEVTYAFCSLHCREKFRADPGQYVPLAQDTHSRAPVAGTVYTCPMHPEVRQDGPGACPRCGMALEPATAALPATQTLYVCPMHPEIVRSEPGACPICGMALEPRTVSVEEEVNPELVDMTRRFWISLIFTVPLLGFVMSEMLPGQPVQHALSTRVITWVQLILATPVVLWGGWPFFARGWASLINRSLNMFTLIAIGIGTAAVAGSRAIPQRGHTPGPPWRTSGCMGQVYTVPATGAPPEGS